MNTVINLLSTFITAQVAVTLETVLSLVLADFILGVLTSLKSGTFNLSKLPQFMEMSLVPYVGGLLVLAIFSSANTELGVLFFSIAATITAKFLADIVLKVTQLFNGVQIQSPITVSAPADPAIKVPIAPPVV